MEAFYSIGLFIWLIFAWPAAIRRERKERFIARIKEDY
jgi:hypothetical protein